MAKLSLRFHPPAFLLVRWTVHCLIALALLGTAACVYRNIPISEIGSTIRYDGFAVTTPTEEGWFVPGGVQSPRSGFLMHIGGNKRHFVGAFVGLWALPSGSSSIDEAVEYLRNRYCQASCFLVDDVEQSMVHHDDARPDCAGYSFFARTKSGDSMFPGPANPWWLSLNAKVCEYLQLRGAFLWVVSLLSGLEDPG